MRTQRLTFQAPRAVPTTEKVHAVRRPPNSAPRYQPMVPVMVVPINQRPHLAIAELAQPDVPETHPYTVVLQLDGKGIGVGEVGRPDRIGGGSEEHLVFLYQDTVMKERYACGHGEPSIAIEMRAVEDDVVRLPLTRCA